jgi:hypothetical protein
VLCALAVAVICGACSLSPGPRPGGPVTPVGQPAGYYPGLGASFVPPAEIAAYQQKNQAGIADVQDRIVAIREGRRRPGCIGEDKYTCVATLAQNLAVTDDELAKANALFADVRNDVNGRSVNADRVNIVGLLPNRAGLGAPKTSFALNVLPDGSVWSIEVTLPQLVELARTQEDYDKTGVYEVVAALASKDCPNLSRMDVDRWVENTVKPSIQEKLDSASAKAATRNNPAIQANRRRRTFESPKLALCGRTFQFKTLSYAIYIGRERARKAVPSITVE